MLCISAFQFVVAISAGMIVGAVLFGFGIWASTRYSLNNDRYE